MFDIILPTIGRDTLRHAIESVLRQTFKDWHLWICFDMPLPTNRSDGLCGMPCDWSLLIHPNVHPLCTGQKHDDCGAFARNYGIQKSAEELVVNPWIAYLDDDDMWLPHHLSVLRQYLDTCRIFRTHGIMVKTRLKRKNSDERIIKQCGVNAADILTPGICHTREIFTKTSGWQSCDNHDHILWKDMIQAGAIPHIIEEPTFQYLRGKRR